jgi:hypothetical protein
MKVHNTCPTCEIPVTCIGVIEVTRFTIFRLGKLYCPVCYMEHFTISGNPVGRVSCLDHNPSSPTLWREFFASHLQLGTFYRIPSHGQLSLLLTTPQTDGTMEDEYISIGPLRPMDNPGDVNYIPVLASQGPQPLYCHCNHCA